MCEGVKIDLKERSQGMNAKQTPHQLMVLQFGAPAFLDAYLRLWGESILQDRKHAMSWRLTYHPVADDAEQDTLQATHSFRTITLRSHLHQFEELYKKTVYKSEPHVSKSSAWKSLIQLQALPGTGCRALLRYRLPGQMACCYTCRQQSLCRTQCAHTLSASARSCC